MLASLDADGTVAAVKVRPVRFGDKLVFRLFSGGHTLAHRLVVIADFLELGGNGLFVRGDA